MLDFQKLLGNINWLCPTLGISNHTLPNLFSIVLPLLQHASSSEYFISSER